MRPQKSRKLVLFLPRRDDPARREPYCADLTPLELLQIAGGPVAEGYQVQLIDAMVDANYKQQVLEACEGALLFASSCILGYQVWDGYQVARAVRERHPALPIVQGGWFPTVAPRMYFEADVADVIGLGQGELTFLEIVQAIESGADLERVAGLALWRDGQVVRTAPRPVVGFEQLPAVPWHLLDFKRYADKQRSQARAVVRHRMPLPVGWKASGVPISFSHFSSFGCPTDCTFCCSPLVTGRRWKAIPGRPLAEDIVELQDRFGFDAVRFNDANWGVSEKRIRAFSEGLLALERPIHWNATIEVDGVLRCSDETLDLARDSGCHLLWIGAETGTREMQERIRKHIEIETIPVALGRLVDRDVTAGCFWIIGFPGEDRASMEETLRQAAHVKHLFPGCASEVYPFRAVPGSADFDEAVRRGYSPPTDFEGWGECFEWKWNSENTPLPVDVRETWRRYIQTAAIYDQHVHEGPRWARQALARIAGWRLRGGRYGFPLEQKLFDVYARMTGARVR